MSLYVTCCISYCFFFFNDTATTEIYTLSLHDALPIYLALAPDGSLYIADLGNGRVRRIGTNGVITTFVPMRSEEHTSELQSQSNLVCRLLLEKKKKEAPERLALPHQPTHAPVASLMHT